MKKCFRALGRYIFYLIRGFFRILPDPLYRIFSGFFMIVCHGVMFKKRRIASHSLRTAFGNEKTKEEIDQIALNCFDNFGRGMIELIYYLDRIPLLKEKISIEGKDVLDQALKEGNGAILVSAHFGNFIMMYLRMVLEGYPTNVIMRRVRDSEWENYISNFRHQNGIKTIYALPHRRCVEKSLKCLRKNEILIILLDQNYGSDGRVFVDFFGKLAATASGPVVFSNRTKAPILPTFIFNNKHDRKVLKISQAIELDKCDDSEVEIKRNVAKITKVIENTIRKYPDQWGGWMHKRWKSRTRAEQIIIDRKNEEATRNRQKESFDFMRR